MEREEEEEGRRKRRHSRRSRAGRNRRNGISTTIDYPTYVQAMHVCYIYIFDFKEKHSINLKPHSQFGFKCLA